MSICHNPVDLNEKITHDLPVLTFGIIADVQYADCDPVGNRYYRHSKERLKAAFETFSKEKVDFVVNLGDLIEKDFGSYKTVLDIIESSGLLTYHITGNHDYSVPDSLKGSIPVLKNQSGYYSLLRECFRFIFLNGNDISTYASGDLKCKIDALSYLQKMRAENMINAMDWNGGLAEHQLDYLNKEIVTATGKNEKVLIFCHFPLFPEDVHNLLNYDEVLQLIKGYDNVIAWFSGHNHKGSYGRLGSTHFVTFRGMVETPVENSFAIIRIYNDRIIIKGFGREPDRELLF